MVIKTRLNGHHVTGSHDIGGMPPHARPFMNLQPKPMAGAMEEATHAPLDSPTLVTVSGENRFHLFMNGMSTHTIPSHVNGAFLSLHHRGVLFAHCLTSLAAHHRSRHVSEITRCFNARKDIQNDGHICLERT